MTNVVDALVDVKLVLEAGFLVSSYAMGFLAGLWSI